MLILGVVLLLLGLLFGVGFLTTIGVILAIVGLVLWVLGSTGRPVAVRKTWF